MKKEQVERVNNFIDVVDDFMKSRGLESEFFSFCTEHHPDFANILLKIGAVSIHGLQGKGE